MNTLVCSQKSPLYLANFSPWKPMSPSIIPTSKQKTLNNPPSTWKAQANAKGFGSTPPSVQETSIKKTSTDADDEKIPEEVMYRIIKRVLASVGAPMALSFASMQLIGASVCGIAYGALSTSMDPNEKGSFLGFEQIQKNWVEMWREEDEGKKSWD
ncbi:PROTEIN PAM68 CHLOROPLASTIC [Salix viminalis]|uniref:PROTEIN PAM68 CHLOROPLASTIC n=1 Tax=Salix viminalis TaxID=40686 RepID=A0A9Q0TB77_SALVM|nr:PROTEIN PAM68 CHLOROPLASTIC [Salix viminalis]